MNAHIYNNNGPSGQGGAGGYNSEAAYPSASSNNNQNDAESGAGAKGDNKTTFNISRASLR